MNDNIPLKLENGQEIGYAWIAARTPNGVLVHMKITDPETYGLLENRVTTSMSLGFVQEPES